MKPQALQNLIYSLQEKSSLIKIAQYYNITINIFLQEDMVCLSCTGTGERVCLSAEGFGNRQCFLESIVDKNVPPDLSQCVFVIEQALSVRALQEIISSNDAEAVSGKSLVV